MSFLENIKDRIANYFLNREMKGPARVPTMTTFNNATKVALIYKGDDEGSVRNVREYVKFLKEKEGIPHVMALGFFDLKEAPEFLQSEIGFDYFTRKDMNWYYRPTTKNVEHFTKKDYDILIDLSANEFLPLKFVALKSKAKFKVGRYSKENEPYYDLMIIGTEKIAMSTYIKQINHYFALLNQQNDK